MLSQALSRVHGDVVLWIGRHSDSAKSLATRIIKVPIWVNTGSAVKTAPSERPIAVQADPTELPFQSSSVDAVILHHTLEDPLDPRLVLREIARVLAPGGRLIVVGINPWSVLGTRALWARVTARFRRDPLNKRRLVNPIRLFDWLTLLGLELDSAPLYAAPGLWRNRPATDNIIAEPSQLPFGSLVVTSAVKPAANLHFRWQQKGRVRLPRTVPVRVRAGVVSFPHVARWRKDDSGDEV